MEPIEGNNCVAAASFPVNSFPPPSTKSLIKDGAISGVLPKTEVLSVHYPGYPSSIARAIETLSGLPKIAKAWSCAIQSLGGTQDPDKPSNGWFSETMIKALSLHVKIRFMEIIPKEASEEFLKSTIKHFRRCRKKETLSMFWKPEKECNGNQDVIHHQELQNKSNNVEREQAQNEVHPFDDEEDGVEDYEEDELDDYESSQMVGEDGVPPYADTYEMGGPNLPGEYLQEILNGFPYGNNGKSHQLGEAGGGSGSSDDEYQIYEQDGDADYDFD